MPCCRNSAGMCLDNEQFGCCVRWGPGGHQTHRGGEQYSSARHHRLDLARRNFYSTAPDGRCVADTTPYRVAIWMMYLAVVMDALLGLIADWSMTAHVWAPIMPDALEVRLTCAKSTASFGILSTASRTRRSHMEIYAGCGVITCNGSRPVTASVTAWLTVALEPRM